MLGENQTDLGKREKSRALWDPQFYWKISSFCIFSFSFSCIRLRFLLPTWVPGQGALAEFSNFLFCNYTPLITLSTLKQPCPRNLTRTYLFFHIMLWSGIVYIACSVASKFSCLAHGQIRATKVSDIQSFKIIISQNFVCFYFRTMITVKPCRRKQKLSACNGEVSSPARPDAYLHICIYKTHLIDRVFTVWLSGSSRFLLHSPLILKKSDIISPSPPPQHPSLLDGPVFTGSGRGCCFTGVLI